MPHIPRYFRGIRYTHEVLHMQIVYTYCVRESVYTFTHIYCTLLILYMCMLGHLGTGRSQVRSLTPPGFVFK